MNYARKDDEKVIVLCASCRDRQCMQIVDNLTNEVIGHLHECRKCFEFGKRIDK